MMVSENPKDFLCCPLDLDELIMQKDITPNVLEFNCANVNNDILFDATRLSTCAYWMFKIDVLERFTPTFRTKIYDCIPALPRITRMYFNYQIEVSNNNELLADYKRFLLETGILGGNPLTNPLKK